MSSSPAMAYTYPYPRMLVTVDALVLLREPSTGRTKILLIKRKNDPFRGCYALPGGFPEMNELLVDAAKRELYEETGLLEVELNPLGVFDRIDRDPRDRNIAIAFYGFTTPDNTAVRAGDDAEEAGWFYLDELPALAFDHGEMIGLLIRLNL